MNDNKNGNIISDMVNSSVFNAKDVANFMARDHRYLQGEFFKLCEYFIAILAHNYENGVYDGRNEYACKAAKVMTDALVEKELLFKPWVEDYLLKDED